VEIAVYVQPRASRTRIVGLHDGRLKVALAAPPVDGKANKALIAFLATTLGVSRSDLALAAGESSRRKRVRVLGLDAAQVEGLLARRVSQSG
jgi:uncharacterized protein (TIGR00251 family)